MSVKRRLQLVPKAPESESEAKILALDEAILITDPKIIMVTLDLYFQWIERASCHLWLHNANRRMLVECVMDYDRDEAVPSEIRVKLKGHNRPLNALPGSSVTFCFEVFKATFEFTTQILAVSYDPEKEGWDLITDIPVEVRTPKKRKLPFRKLTDEIRRSLPSVIWIQAGQKTSGIQLKILEASMVSIKAECESELIDHGIIRLGDFDVPATIEKIEEKNFVLNLHFEDVRTFGKYFDFYRRISFPCLRSRYEIPYEKGIELYKRSNYFGTFNSEKTNREMQKVCETWEDIKTGFHETTVDYYVIDKDGEPTGCSGIALTNFSGSTPIWTFHQLCALKNPDLIEESGILYTWRAEYLASRPGEVKVWGTFRSQSRWLERIYVKHALNCSGDSKLIPAKNHHSDITGAGRKPEMKVRTFKFGNLNRVCSESEDLWAGVGPRFLNANENLNTVVAVFKTVSLEELEAIGMQMVSHSEEKNLQMVFVIPPDQDISSFGGRSGKSDRFFLFPKKDLNSFITSVEHSVAITERKLRNGGTE